MTESIRAQLGYGVTISLIDPDLFIYAETAVAVRAAGGTVRDVLAEFFLPHTVQIEFRRSAGETWEPVDDAALDAAAESEASTGDRAQDGDEPAGQEQEQEADNSSEDWRVRVSFHPPGNGLVFKKAPRGQEPGLAESIRAQLGYEYGVTISLSDPDLFLYAKSRDSVRRADRVVRQMLAGSFVSHTVQTEFWYPVREIWEQVTEATLDAAAEGGAIADGDLIPDDEELAGLERAHQDAMRRIQAQPGEANWEVRIEFPDHRTCRDYARLLGQAGHPAVLHGRYLLLGARSEYEASVLARMITQEGPPDAVVTTMLAPYTATTVFAVEMMDARVAREAGDASDLGSEIADLGTGDTTVAGALDSGAGALHAASDVLHAASDTVELAKAGATGERETAPDGSVSDLGRNVAALVETTNTDEGQFAADVLNLGSDLVDVREDSAKLMGKGNTREGKSVADTLALESDILQVASDVLGLGSDVVKRARK